MNENPSPEDDTLSADTGAVERESRFGLWPAALSLVALNAVMVLLSWSRTGFVLELDITRRWPALVGLSALVLISVLYLDRKHRAFAAMEIRLRDLAAREAGFSARFGELSFLFDISTQLQLRLDLPSMLDLAAQRLLACLDATQSSIMLYDEQQGVLEVKAAAGVDLALVRGGRVVPGEGIAGHVYAKGEALLLTPRVVRERFAQQVKHARSIGSGLCVPMRFRDKPIGVISVTRTSGDSFEPSHVKMLEAFAAHCAATVVKTHHHHDMLRHVKQAA